MRDSANAEKKALLTDKSKATPTSENGRNSAHQTDHFKKANEGLGLQPNTNNMVVTHTQACSQDMLPSVKTQLSHSAHSCIGTQMCTLYNDLLQEEVPDQFLKLLEELDRKCPPG